jgi:valyl-tRNA synthetase
MVCSYGDQNDVQVFRELGLSEIVALNENGITTAAAGHYSGLRVNQARTKITEDLKSAGLLEREQEIMHRTPLCERSKTPIEIIPLQDYYVKQLDFIPKLREAANTKLEFHPEMHRQILLNWLDSIAIDWPVSRRRFYGTEIPIWYCKNCLSPNVPPPGKYYRPWKEKPPFDRCQKCGGSEFTGEERTFDTWMDSSISPLYVTKYHVNNNNHRDNDNHSGNSDIRAGDGNVEEGLFEYAYPTALRPQAKDIIRTWLHYTMLRCMQLTDQVPWHQAWIMGYGVDEKGEKMSKSKGNVIDPFPVIQKYGADTFRFWSASEASLGYDFRCSEQRIASAQKFLSKLWNLGRFLSSFPAVLERPDELETSDRWILAELARLQEECKRGYLEFNFWIPANAIREFTWNVFAAHYVEMIKGRAYDPANTGRASALYTLHHCFSSILLLLAPIAPFITDELWSKIYHDYSNGRNIHQSGRIFSDAVVVVTTTDAAGPATNDDYKSMLHYTKQITEFNSMVWNKKKETTSKETGKPLSLKDPIEIAIPAVLVPFAKDLESMHNLVTRKKE